MGGKDLLFLLCLFGLLLLLYLLVGGLDVVVGGRHGKGLLFLLCLFRLLLLLHLHVGGLDLVVHLLLVVAVGFLLALRVTFLPILVFLLLLGECFLLVSLLVLVFDGVQDVLDVGVCPHCLLVWVRY